jgi:rubrerythrin
MSQAVVFQIANRFINKSTKGIEKDWECRACGSRLTEETAQATDWDCPACGASTKPVQEPITNIKALKEA